MADSLGVEGPRGVAFRATDRGNLRTAVYYRSEQHTGSSWTNRLTALLAASQYPEDLVSTIEEHLKELYQPGPVGVIGVDDGYDGVPGTLKFDPSNVPLSATFAFLARVGVSAVRIAALRTIATALRAESATYVGVQYGPQGFVGWRVYFACEPSYARLPGQMAFAFQRNLRSIRRLPHY
jgi:hypothetical protein